MPGEAQPRANPRPLECLFLASSHGLPKSALRKLAIVPSQCALRRYFSSLHDILTEYPQLLSLCILLPSDIQKIGRVGRGSASRSRVARQGSIGW